MLTVNTISQINRFVRLIAGVGSGKTTFIEKLVKGEIEGAGKPCVLLITSRRAKVDETLQSYDNNEYNLFKEKIGVGGNVNLIERYEEEREAHKQYLRVIEDDEGRRHHVYEQSVVCTNAFIENYFKYVYDPDDINTHLWQLFDIIVVDEIHSMVMDATYQSAPFHVSCLINKYLEQKMQGTARCNQLILMTGTPQPIRNYVAEGIEETVIDLMNVCDNVVPRNIHFISKRAKTNKIKTLIENGERIIYFTNHTEVPQDISNQYDIPIEKVATTFSEETKRKDLANKDKDAYERMLRVEEYIKTQQMIPDDIQMLVTTTRYKEGININNADVNHMFMESHIESDVIQMSGRIRNGVENLYMITDTKGHIPDADEQRLRIAEKKLIRGSEIIQKINQYYFSLSDDISIRDLIEMIENRFRYIRFDYIHKVFNEYTQCIEGDEYCIKQNHAWDVYSNANHLHDMLVNYWYPMSIIHLSTSQRAAANKAVRDDKANCMREYWEKNHIELNREYSDSEFRVILSELNKINGTENLTIKSLLKLFCKYKHRTSGGHKNPRHIFFEAT